MTEKITLGRTLTQGERERSSGIINGIAFELSSENVFRDLELDDADRLKIESSLAIEIALRARRDFRYLNQAVSFLKPIDPA